MGSSTYPLRIITDIGDVCVCALKHIRKNIVSLEAVIQIIRWAREEVPAHCSCSYVFFFAAIPTIMDGAESAIY